MCGDRKKSEKSDPIFELYNDVANQQIVLKIVEVRAEAMYKTPKERVDIYFLKPGAETLRDGLNSLVDPITSAIKQDRSIREAKDSRYKYDDSGLPLRIDATEGWIKIMLVEACFAEKHFSIECKRVLPEDDIPKINIDLEWSNSRMHFGIELNWSTTEILAKHDNITIKISWTEFAHFLNAIRNIVSEMR